MQTEDGLPTPARYYAMAVIILGIALSVLDGTIVNLALPGIARDLNASAAHTVWVVNAYQIATLGLLLPCAMLGDLVGYRRVYLSGLVLFTIASLACALAGSLPLLALARAAQGLGAAGMMSVNAALLRLVYPRRLLGRGVALNSLVVASASVAGPTIAAGILSLASWPWLFVFNVPLGVFVMWLGRRSLPRNPAPAPAGVRLSWLDVLMNLLMFALVFLGVDALGAHGAGGSATVGAGWAIALLIGGFGVGWVYLRRQFRLPLPLFPLDLLRIPVFALSMCSSVGAFSAQMLAYTALPFLLLDSYGMTPLQAGGLITFWPIATMVIAPVAGRLIGRWPDGLLGGIGMVLMASGLALLALLPQQPDSHAIAWRMALCGAGFGFFQSPNNHTIVTSAPLHRAGGASGMLGTARLTGQTLGAVLLSIIFSLTGAHTSRGPMLALALAACFALAAAAFSSLRVAHMPAAAP